MKPKKRLYVRKMVAYSYLWKNTLFVLVKKLCFNDFASDGIIYLYLHNFVTVIMGSISTNIGFNMWITELEKLSIWAIYLEWDIIGTSKLCCLVSTKCGSGLSVGSLTSPQVLRLWLGCNKMQLMMNKPPIHSGHWHKSQTTSQGEVHNVLDIMKYVSVLSLGWRDTENMSEGM